MAKRNKWKPNAVLFALICWLPGRASLQGEPVLARGDGFTNAAASSPVQPARYHLPPGAARFSATAPELGRTPRPGPRPTPDDVLAAQLSLARQAISPGSLDGLMGLQTRSALATYLEKIGWEATAESNAVLAAAAALEVPLLTNHVVGAEELANLQPVGPTWLAKSQQNRLEYETVLERIAEKSMAHPKLLRRLNPSVDWSNVVAGTVVQIPNAEYPLVTEKAAVVRIFLSRRVLQALGASSNLLAHFPCSIGQRVDKRPVGELHVSVVIPDPNYTFDPEVFPESEEGRQLGRKLILQPGPNNPVGLAWIGLDRPGYGIHGTPQPEQVGRTESHGCFRLANWNAQHLLSLVWVGMPVLVEP